jgi:anti-anti-sigma regulatory factor
MAAIAPQLQVDVAHVPLAPTATVALVGEVDISGVAALHHAVDEIARAAPSTVYVDLSATTFAGAPLLTFLIAVRAAISIDAHLVLRRPSPLTRRLVEVTSVDSILTFDAADTVNADARDPGC